MTLVTIAPQELQLQEPERPYRVPDITAEHYVNPAQLGMDGNLAPATITTFEVRDSYVEAIAPDRVAEIKEQQAKANDHARQRRQSGYWDRKPGTAYQNADGGVAVKGSREWGDPVSSTEFFGTPGEADELDPGLSVWKGLVPAAEALSFISDPTRFTSITSRRGQTADFSPAAQEWMAVCDDGLGIRSRGAAMAKSVKEYIDWYRWSHPNVTDAEITMLSVACGTALPTIQGAMSAHAGGATLLLVDSNSRSMSGAGELAEEVGFEGRLVTAKRDIFDRQVMANLRDELMQGGVDRRPLIVDAMGIFEYTGRELLAEGQPDNGSLLYDPVSFLSAVYDLVRPGGRLIFGQMRDDRPNPDFTMGVVRWPYVCMRSPKEVMEIVKAAGIDPAWVTLALTPDGVYTVASIDKPGAVEPTVVQRQTRRTRNERPQAPAPGVRPETARSAGRGALSGIRARIRQAAASAMMSF